jgi:anti-sigma B factor antagonist
VVPGQSAELGGDSGELAEQAIELAVRKPADRISVVRVQGEIDLLTTPSLDACIDEQFGDLDVLVLDLQGVQFLASSGLAVLVRARDRARAENVALRLVCTTRAVLRPLAATGLADLFDTYDDAEKAITAD